MRTFIQSKMADSSLISISIFETEEAGKISTSFYGQLKNSVHVSAHGDCTFAKEFNQYSFKWLVKWG